MQEAYIRIYIPGIYQAARAFCLSVTSVAHQASPVSEQGPRDSTAAAYVFRNEPTRVFDVYGLCDSCPDDDARFCVLTNCDKIL